MIIRLACETPFVHGGRPPGKQPNRSRLHSILPSLLGAALTFGLGLAGGTADAAQARTGTIRVEVVAGAIPIEGANVSANGVSTSTDTSGAGTLTLPPGLASVVATKDGYQPATARVDVVAGAERTVRLVMLPTAIVASTRTGRHIEDQAAPVALVNRDQIEARMLKAPGDIVTLFNEMPGVRAQTTSPVLGTTMLRIRGLPGHYTRVLSDGVPVYFDRPGGHALLRMPPMDLGQVEVIKEPASALFGSDAVSVVNLLSRRPDNQPSREILFSQSAPNATDARALDLVAADRVVEQHVPLRRTPSGRNRRG